MNWKELRIYTTHEKIEIVSAELFAAGISGLVINDPEDIKEFAAEKNSSWDYIDDDLLKSAASGEPYITAYVQDGDDGAADLEAVFGALENAKSLGCEVRVESNDIREEDWANNWKRYFKPLDIGEKLLIKPSWEEVVDPSGRHIIELDPENSFGTGRHHTTQLCLELVEKYVKRGDSVIDLGCGSGIIFIAAMVLGASHAVGVDISEDAVKISARNAMNNKILRNSFEVYCGDPVTDDGVHKKIRKAYDLVTANIVADVLLSMKDLFAELTKPASHLILSGIIDGRLDEVVNAVKQNGFTLLETKRQDIWNAAVFIKL